jgi:hypothetical protein
MFRLGVLAFLGIVFLTPAVLQAQVPDWRPPSTEMPMMPTVAELQGDWHGPRAAWFRGVETLSGSAVADLRAIARATGPDGRAQVAVFSSGPVPVVIWSDRNGDGRSDMIEIFRSGGVIIQVVDASFDGRANVMRVYDSEGRLLRQTAL